MARYRNILGLDIGTYSIKALELSLSSDGEVTVTGLAWERIPSPEMVEDTIYSVLAHPDLKSRRVVTAVSGRSVIVRQVSMAAMEPEELRKAVRDIADKYIPYDVEEVQLDCQELGKGKEKDGQTRVLLVAAKRDLILEHANMIQRVGLRPVIIDVDLFALANAFELCNRQERMAKEDEVVALVDIGASKTSICILKGREECFTREVYTAGNAFTDAIAKRFGEDPKEVERMKEDPGAALESMREAMLSTMEDLANDVRLSFEYYENQFDMPVSRVYLSGGTILFPGIVEALGEIFEIETERFHPFESIRVTASNEILVKERPSDFVIALGLASRLCGM